MSYLLVFCIMMNNVPHIGREGQFFCWIKLIRNPRIFCECHISLKHHRDEVLVADCQHFDIDWKQFDDDRCTAHYFSGEIFTHSYFFKRAIYKEEKCWWGRSCPPAVILHCSSCSVVTFEWCIGIVFFVCFWWNL